VPAVEVDGIQLNYEEQGEGEPLVLIPYLSADNACYAFQYPAWAERYRCISVDLRGSGLSDKPHGSYSTRQYADDVAGIMDALGIERAHVAGVSLGAATAMCLAGTRPSRVASLALHSGWAATDPFLAAVVNTWRVMALSMDSVADMVIAGIFPWCFTPEMYAERPEFVSGLAEFVRSRPAQPSEAFLGQSDAVLGHDATDLLGEITAPTLITFGRHDLVTSTRFAGALEEGIQDSELVVFDHLSHAGLHEDAETFNRVTTEFMERHPL